MTEEITKETISAGLRKLQLNSVYGVRGQVYRGLKYVNPILRKEMKYLNIQDLIDSLNSILEDSGNLPIVYDSGNKTEFIYNLKVKECEMLDVQNPILAVLINGKL